MQDPHKRTSIIDSGALQTRNTLNKMHSPQGINPGRQAIDAGCKAFHIPDTPHYQFKTGHLRIKHPTSHQSDLWTPWLKHVTIQVTTKNKTTRDASRSTKADATSDADHKSSTSRDTSEEQRGGVPSLAEDERNPSRVQTNAGSLRHRSIRINQKHENQKTKCYYPSYKTCKYASAIWTIYICYKSIDSYLFIIKCLVGESK